MAGSVEDGTGNSLTLTKRNSVVPGPHKTAEFPANPPGIDQLGQLAVLPAHHRGVVIDALAGSHRSLIADPAGPVVGPNQGHAIRQLDVPLLVEFRPFRPHVGNDRGVRLHLADQLDLPGDAPG